MTDLPVIGAQMTVLDIDRHRDWLFAENRDLELAEFCMADVLDKPDTFIDMAKAKLDGWAGRLGIHGPFSGFELDTKDKEVRAVVQKRLDQALDVCARLGATQMVIHSPYTHWDVGNLDAKPDGRGARTGVILDTLGPAIGRAEDLGVEMVLENIRDTDPMHRADVVAAADSPALRLSLDVGHAFWAERSSAAPQGPDWVRAAGTLLGHIHLQDVDGVADRHWVPGEGDVDFSGIFAALGDTGTRPRLIIEIKDYDRIGDAGAYFAATALGK